MGTRAESSAEPVISRRAAVLEAMCERLYRTTDHLICKLMIAQWVAASVLALAIAPQYAGETLVAGGLMSWTCVAMVRLRPGWWCTRHAIAIVQLSWSALLIAITGGRAETHFHMFVSLAVLAVYRDWRVLRTATLVIVADHVIRGIWQPATLYGAADPGWGRTLEHATWLAAAVAILGYLAVHGMRDLAAAAKREVRLEHTMAVMDRKVAERTVGLEYSMERYRSLVENTEAVQFEYDVEAHRLVYVAPQATRLLDCTAAELAEPGFLATVVHAADRDAVAAAVAACASGARSSSDPIDCRLVTTTGRVVFARTFLRREGGRRVRGVTLDVTRQRQLESELQHRRMLESVGRIAAGVAHEINTPIQFVGDSVEFARGAIAEIANVLERQREVIASVLDGDPSVELALRADSIFRHSDSPYLLDELPKALDRALDGVERVARIVRSMKVVARPDQVEMVDVDLNRAIESTLIVARNEYRYVADLVTDLGELPPVKCHAGEISQVILNVAVNAAHAIGDVVGKSGDRGRIEVKTRAAADRVTISISDTGGGIPDAVAHRIFEPFFTTKQVGKGTGQGLAIARSVIVDRYNGSITFETASTGTTFHIALPVTRERAEDRSSAPERLPTGGGRGTTEQVAAA